MIKGIKKLFFLDIVLKIELLGVRLGSDIIVDYFLLSMKIVLEDFDDIFWLLGEIIRCFFFFEIEIELEKWIII